MVVIEGPGLTRSRRVMAVWLGLGGPPARSTPDSWALSAPSSDLAAAAWRWGASLRAPPGGAGWIGGAGGGMTVAGGATLRPTAAGAMFSAEGLALAGGGGGGGGGGRQGWDPRREGRRRAEGPAGLEDDRPAGGFVCDGEDGDRVGAGVVALAD